MVAQGHAQRVGLDRRKASEAEDVSPVELQGIFGNAGDVFGAGVHDVNRARHEITDGRVRFLDVLQNNTRS